MVDDVDPKQVWEALRADKSARLVDVRTDAEWTFVGLPDLEETGQDPVLIPWQVFPAMQVDDEVNPGAAHSLAHSEMILPLACIARLPPFSSATDPSECRAHKENRLCCRKQ